MSIARSLLAEGHRRAQGMGRQGTGPCLAGVGGDAEEVVLLDGCGHWISFGGFFASWYFMGRVVLLSMVFQLCGYLNLGLLTTFVDFLLFYDDRSSCSPKSS